MLALNPSIDAEWRVDTVRWGEKNLVTSERRWPGGKGVNVARWLCHLGEKTRLLLPLGGNPGRELAHQLRSEKLPATIVSLAQPTRVNVIVTTADRRQMRFNPIGPKLGAAEWREVFRAAGSALGSTDCLILSGSLPRQAPVGVYARLIRQARATGCITLLDCDGASFAAAVGAKPFLVKPNVHELAQWFGRDLPSESKILRAARTLSRATDGWVLVSCGGQGALLVNAAQRCEFKTRAPRVETWNTVGAGDAMLAAVAGKFAFVPHPKIGCAGASRPEPPPRRAKPENCPRPV